MDRAPAGARVVAGDKKLFTGISVDLGNAEIERQITYAREAGAHGFVLFDLTQLRANGTLDALAQGVLRDPLPPPTR